MGGNLALWKHLAIGSKAIQGKTEARTVHSPTGPTADLPQMALPRQALDWRLPYGLESTRDSTPLLESLRHWTVRKERGRNVTCVENLPSIQGVPSLPSESLPVSSCEIFHLSWVLLSHGQTWNDCPYSHTMTHEGSWCSGEVAGHAQSHTAVSREPEFKPQPPDLALGLPPLDCGSSSGQSVELFWRVDSWSSEFSQPLVPRTEVLKERPWPLYQYHPEPPRNVTPVASEMTAQINTCLQAWWTEFHPWDQTQGTTHSTMSSLDHHMGCGLSLPNILLSNNHYNFERNDNSWVLLCS